MRSHTQSIYTRQGTGATPGPYSIASAKQQQLNAYKASWNIERGGEEGDEGEEGDASDGNGSVSGTEFGSLTSVE